MVLAVLEARCGVSFAGKDVYLNVAGGLRINEPAADLAVAAAIASSAFDVPLPKDSVVFGEISLSGDVRPVGRSDARLKEAAKLGFKTAITATPSKKRTKNDNAALPIIAIKALPDLIRRVEASSERGLEDDSAWGSSVKAA
jgi:DNA repair protein RadA/Sms